MRIFILIAFIFSSICASSQKINFPQDYLGTWKGTLKMHPSGTEIPMSIQLGPELKKNAVYKYIITYEGETKDVREYELCVIDKQQGLFNVDEKNGIILEEKLLGNKLISVFSVSGSSLLITLELLSDTIIFEVYSWKSDVYKTTETKESEDNYIVKSFITNGYQRAVLKK